MQQNSARFNDLVAYAASRLRSGSTPETLQADLLNRDVAPELAGQVVAEAAARNRRRGVRSGLKYLAIGVGCFTLGVVITGATYSAAMHGGGDYFITLGLFGFGIAYTLGGLARLLFAAVAGR